MAFAIGHEYSKRSRQIEANLKRLVAQDKYKKLDRACERLLESAAEGETWQERMAAFNVLADRLDGKVRSDDTGGDGETRSIPLSQLVAAILAARKADAIDAPEAIEQVDQPAILPGVSKPDTP